MSVVAQEPATYLPSCSANLEISYRHSSRLGWFRASSPVVDRPSRKSRASTPKVENKVDKRPTSWKIYKRQRCETCHGPTGGRPAFPICQTAKNLSKQFQQVVLEGRKICLPKGNKAVVDNIDGLYAYIKAVLMAPSAGDGRNAVTWPKAK